MISMPPCARSYTFCAACSSSAFQALGEGVLRLFSVVLLIAASEVAAAGEAHECSGWFDSGLTPASAESLH